MNRNSDKRGMAMVLINGRMEQSMKENGRITKCMGKGFTPGQTEANIQAAMLTM